MKYLMYSNESSVTGRALGQAIRDEGVDLAMGHEPPARMQDRITHLIRWGSIRQLPLRPTKVINKLKAIQSASNKLVALETLDTSGVRVPHIYRDVSTLPRECFPLLGRKERHHGGNDIILCLQRSDTERARQSGCTYFTKYIPTRGEYRAHVFGGEVIKLSQKILTDPEAAKEPWVRNLDAGYTFREPRTRLTPEDQNLAVRAVENLGLDFGAVDLIMSDDNIPYILEVNTAPGLIETGIEMYVDKFVQILNED